MATVSLTQSKQTLSKTQEIGEFLRGHGITFQHWPVPPDLEGLRAQASLTDAEKGQVLKGYQERLDVEARERSYVQADMIVLNPSTPGLAEVLAKFDKAHYHDDDEVRYIFDGEGTFGFEPQTASPFRVNVSAGDYIIVPAKTYHWFTLTESRTIKAIRLFKDMSGWVPHYKA